MNELDNKNTNVEESGATNSYSYDEAVEMTGHGRYNYLLLAACSVITTAVALDMFGFSVVVAAANCDLQLGIRETGILASAPFAGIIFAFPWGYFADTGGRRRALLLSTSVGFTLAALSSFAPSWQVMLGIKLLGCAFSTAAFTLTMTYLGESIGNQRRSRYLFVLNAANMAAEILFYGLALVLLPLTFNLPIPWLGIAFRPWRLYTLVLALPLGIGALMLLTLHESPKFLASRGKEDQAMEVLRCIYEANGGKRENYPVQALSSIHTADISRESFWSSLVKQTVPLFKPPLLWRTLQLFYIITLCCSTNNVFLMWYPIMVNLFFNSFLEGSDGGDMSFCQRVVANITVSDDADNYVCDDTISTNTIYSGIILGMVFVTLNLTAAGMASWRRLVLITTFVISAVCLILVNFLRDPVANMVAFTLVQTTAIGIGSIASYFVDLYPTAYRGLVTSLGLMVARLVSLGGVNLVGVVIVHHCRLTFQCWTAYVCSGIVMALFLPSDRKPDKPVEPERE